MNYRKTIAIALMSLFFTQISFAQKKQLDHSVYDDWKSLSNTSVSNDGRFVVAIIKPQEGDSKLFIQDLKKDKKFEHNRISKYTMSPDGKRTVALLKAPFADTRQAKIDKKKKDKMPKDSLIVINNETFDYYIIPNVESYKTSQELGNYVAYITTSSVNTANITKDTATSKEKNNKKKEVLIVHNITTQLEDKTYEGYEYNLTIEYEEDLDYDKEVIVTVIKVDKLYYVVMKK